MKKEDIIKIWKQDFKLDSKTINKVLEFVFNINKEELFLSKELDDIYNWQIFFIFEKISNNYPLEYITKKLEFYWKEFYIDENVLIPRIDTEILVEKVIKHIKKQKDEIYLLDIWTWSGIIILSILDEIKEKIKRAYAIDISKKAIEVAIRNAYEKKLEIFIDFINMDFRNFEFNLLQNKNLVITANLPYIKENDFENMTESTYRYEPEIALYGWRNSWFEMYMDLIEILIEKKDLFASLDLFIEIWFDQWEISKNFLEEKWLKFEIFKDTNNISRTIKIKI